MAAGVEALAEDPPAERSHRGADAEPAGDLLGQALLGLIELEADVGDLIDMADRES